MTVHKQIITNRVAFLEKKVPLYASALGLIGLLVLWEIICSTKIVSPLILTCSFCYFSDRMGYAHKW